MLLLVCLYRRTNDGGDVQSSARMRSVSTRDFGTAAVNTPQSSSQGSNTRNSVTTSTPAASYPPHSQTQSPQPGKSFKDGAHYCYCAHFLRTPRQSRATRKKCATHRTRGLVLSPVSLGGSSYFLWKRYVVFQQMKNNLPCQFFENRRSMRMLLFLHMIDLTEHFIVKRKQERIKGTEKASSIHPLFHR